jgi:signal transduction histidine kinase
MKKPGAVELQARIKRAGQTLHDDVAPLLTGAGLQLQLLRMDHPESAQQIDLVARILDDAMERVRQLSQQLAPSPFTPAHPEE